MTEKICFLVDDDEDDREVFQMAFQQLKGIECVTSHNGREALEMLSDDTFNPDFIFLDLNMPMMSGKECLKEIRKMKRFSTTPIWIYTTSSQQGDKIELEKLGATGFITKPIRLSSLMKLIIDLLYA